VTADDFATLARAALSDTVWDYVAGGSGEELTVAANTRVFDDVYIAPRLLVDVSACDTSTTLLGTALRAPIGVAPTAYQELVHPTAEIGMARGAGAAGAFCVVSMFATRTIEDIAAAASGPMWLQLYWLRRREALVDMAWRAAEAGFKALVLTVDAPRIGERRRDMRNGFAVPATMRAVNLDPSLMSVVHEAEPGSSALASHADATFDTTVTWSDLEWLRGITDLPLFIKGVLTAEDAMLAVSHGADGIVVSNHGGRQIDGALPSLVALPAVVAAVAGQATVVMDGGVRRGRDVFVALALGADAVMLGRPLLWALASGGEEAVTRQLELIGEELLHVMALAGRPNVADIGPDAVVWADRR
jgi:4-hydroxymandelate oxidase